MIQGISDRPWQAEARTAETKQFIRDIKRITRRKFTAEEKIRIVLEGFRRDTPIRDLCRREGIRPSTYYAWLKDFMEAGKERLTRDVCGQQKWDNVGLRSNGHFRGHCPAPWRFYYSSFFLLMSCSLPPSFQKSPCPLAS